LNGALFDPERRLGPRRITPPFDDDAPATFWLKKRRRNFLLPRRPCFGYGNFPDSTETVSPDATETSFPVSALILADQRAWVLQGRFLASPGFAKIATETDSIDLLLIMDRSADLGTPDSHPPPPFDSVVTSAMLQKNKKIQN
jgi:hypothetical protein